jgi:hypothetical protein
MDKTEHEIQGYFIYIYQEHKFVATKFDEKKCPTSLHESETIQRKRKGRMEEYM